MYFSIEGCIGSGKTTVAKLLCRDKHFKLILEEFEKNPFLDRFYLEPGEHDFETELAFVLIHYHQLKEILVAEPKINYVSDFYIGKDLIYAKNNLSGNEYNIFERLYQELSPKTPTPDLIICLEGSDEFIVRRILERNRGKEGAINVEYFKLLNQRYKDFFKTLEIPKVMVDMEKRDFLKDPDQINWLVKEIDLLVKANEFGPWKTDYHQ